MYANDHAADIAVSYQNQKMHILPWLTSDSRCLSIITCNDVLERNVAHWYYKSYIVLGMRSLIP